MPAWAPDWPKTLFAALIGVLALGRAWAAFRPGSRVALLVDRVRRLPYSRQIVLAVLAVAAFGMVAEDVLEREHDELVLRVDRAMQDGARAVASSPAVRDIAAVVSHLTGEGLVAAVLTAVAFLLALQRRRDAAVVAVGSLGAWTLSAALKMQLAVPRPAARGARHAITGYGFPSSHVLVTFVVCGLLAWVLGKERTPRVRFSLFAGAGAVAVSGGAARMLLNAHWASDVIAGLAIAIVWLTLVILGASWGAAAGVPR